MQTKKKKQHRRMNLVKFFSEYHAIHDLEDTFESLDLLGKDHYSTRALQMPFDNVFLKNDYKDELQKLFDYYKKIGIGPKKITFVDGKSLITSALKHIQENKEKVKISLFGISKNTADKIDEFISSTEFDFLKKLDKIPKVVASICEKMNSKFELRKFISAKKKYVDFKIEFVLEDQNENKDEENFEKLKENIGNGAKVIIKPLKSTGGDGILITSEYQDVKRYKRNYRNKFKTFEDKFIYEEYVQFYSEASVQFLVLKGENNKKYIQFLSFTRQMIKGVSHEGNILSNDPKSEINNLISKKILRKLTDLVLEFSEENDYRGYIGVDIGIVNKDKIVIFEFNSRMTGSTYPLLVLKQIEEKYKGHFTVASTNSIKPRKNISSLDDLLSFLNTIDKEILFEKDRLTGLIPTLVTTLPEKVGFLSIAENEEKALEQLDKVKSLLEKSI